MRVECAQAARTRRAHRSVSVLIPMSDDPSHTWSSVRRVSKSVCAVCVPLCIAGRPQDECSAVG